MKLVILVFVFLFCFNFISAICNENQIDINSASASDLQKITYIGEVRAKEIIDSRPFDSVDELIDIYGIGEKTLEKIKTQGLACVVDEKENEKLEIVDDKKETEVEKEITQIADNVVELKSEDKTKETETIKLSPQNIKSENNKEDKSKYANYGIVAFFVLILGLFVFKFLNKKRYTNEFRG